MLVKLGRSKHCAETVDVKIGTAGHPQGKSSPTHLLIERRKETNRDRQQCSLNNCEVVLLKGMQEGSRTRSGQEVSSPRSHNELCVSQASGKAINTALRPVATSDLDIESGYKNRHPNKSKVTLNP